MTDFQRALHRLSKAMPGGMAFFGFLLILFGIIGVLTTSSEISEKQNSTDPRKQASVPQELPNPPAGCSYQPVACYEAGCTTAYELVCTPVPYPVAPARPDGKILWETLDAALFADRMVITLADGRKFTTTDIQVRLGSDPVSVTNPNYTTLEGTWFEEDVEMRVYMYIYSNPQSNLWYVDELRVYNGNTPGDWIEFKKPVELTGAAYGQPLTWSGTRTLTSTVADDSTTISFTNLELRAFLRKPPYCSEQGHRPSDISGDERVDILDVSTLTNSFFQTGELDSDLTCDELVDLEDYTVLINQLRL